MNQPTIKCPKCNTDNPAENNYCSACATLLKPSLVNQNQQCPFCQAFVKPDDYFCPTCSKKLREKPLSSSILKQISIYLISFFLPPLGLWPGFKYLRQNDQKLKAIGGIAILLTLISLVVSALLAVNVINSVNDQVNKQLQNMTF